MAGKRRKVTDRERVSKYLFELMDGQIGVGEDPVGFLIASHNSLSLYYRRSLERIEELEANLAQYAKAYHSELDRAKDTL